jgi:hypothetical protein
VQVGIPRRREKQWNDDDGFGWQIKNSGCGPWWAEERSESDRRRQPVVTPQPTNASTEVNVVWRKGGEEADASVKTGVGRRQEASSGGCRCMTLGKFSATSKLQDGRESERGGKHWNWFSGRIDGSGSNREGRRKVRRPRQGG